jgi:anti-sigma B factor antagonist
VIIQGGKMAAAGSRDLVNPLQIVTGSVLFWTDRPSCGCSTTGFTRAPVIGDRGISMPLKMTNSEVNGVSVVELEGRVVLGDESNSLRERLKSLIAEGKKKIVLNMADIKYIDSAGLGTLVAAHLSAKNRGASVRLCHLGKKFHEVMQLTKLLTIFDVYDTEAAAVSSFQSFLVTTN